MPEIERLHLDVARQELSGFAGSRELCRFPVSTAQRASDAEKDRFKLRTARIVSG